MASPAPVPRPHALDAIADQPQARDLLAAALAEDRLSHAYLFVGAPGSGMEEAAEALAKCVVCPAGGDGTCGECIRVAHRTHPDVHWLEPASAVGYLVDQVRDLIADVSLAPSRAHAKVYVLQRVELLRGAAANALLKTIEEPPADVVFVLLARTLEAVLPTIASRCQVVPFRVVAPDAARAEVVRATGASDVEAGIALAVAGTPSRAADFLASTARRNVRRLVVRTLDALPRDDSWDVLRAASDLLEAVRVPLGELRQAQEAALKDSSEFLAAAALKQLEAANRRELTARERSGIMEAIAAADSVLRDVLLRCEGVPAPPTNADATDVVDRLASLTDTSGVLAALDATAHARDDLAHNVSPQLSLEVMLLAVKEALTCPPSSR